jgi:hypothetical protein
MNPNTKLLIAGAILIVALAFYFLGEGLLSTAEAPEDGAMRPREWLRALSA